ncbi:hypothetical protein BJ322DRAFT_996208 [Thelephora terrestris]|uniref:VanZ-like domain-containing protein n=1 Tax=Thelephora terrestris TaxID=56493 RepID=A0A9P6HQN1_9AGAM|nr:hypothetical protein BJ322DRAFT_996208 [Thelephora terrestris]
MVNSFASRTCKNVQRYLRKAKKAVMRSHHFRIPIYDMPIRLRPWFIVFTFIVMLVLAFLGFTNISHSLPLNDKLLHFMCLGIATGIFYFIFDVEDDARRIWFWRHSPLIFTGIVCFFAGGFISEVVQSTLPYKEFQIGDVVANLFGSSVGLFISYHLEKYYRHRREISQLYRPLDTEYLSNGEDEDDLESGGVQLQATSQHQHKSSSNNKIPETGAIRLGDVWDEREELFGVGGDSDED